MRGVFGLERVRGGEKRIVGIAGSIDGSVAIGRICSLCECSVGGGASILYLSEAPDDLLAVMAVSPSGVILSHLSVSPSLLCFLFAKRIPYIILKEKPSVLLELVGSVALIDVGRNLLVIDPSLEALGRYAPRLAPSQIGLFSSCSEPRFLYERGGGGIMLCCPPNRRGREVADALVTLIEEHPSLPIFVQLPVPTCEAEREAFCEQMETLFCVALYGDIRILLDGYSSPSQIDVALECMHRAFCSLEAESREFNGYIKRGLVIGAPIWLLRPSFASRADTLCFDIDRLAFGLLEAHPKSDDVAITVADVICDGISRLGVGARDAAVICSDPARSIIFKRILEKTGINRVFCECENEGPRV